MSADFTWKVLLDAMPTGGNYSATVTCPSSQGAGSAHIADLTFGDVWLCSGQSNMWLPIWFTFNRNETTAAILSGQYANIRIFRGGLGTSNISGNWVGPAGPSPGSNGNDALTGQWRHPIDVLPPITPEFRPGEPWLWEFPSTCFYTAQYLTDLLGADAPPLGLVSVPVGGTMVEQWTPWEVQTTQCTNVTCMCTGQGCDSYQPLNSANCTANANLYHGNIQPFVNLTLKGFLWYQGENNLAYDAGNYAEGTGYGCLFPRMVAAWRALWSVVPGTTDPMAPFGFVTLADGTDEGWSLNMARLQWSQTANYGYVPNPALPATFMAQGYDVGDPWDADLCADPFSCCVDDAMPLGPKCTGDHRGQWDENGTSWFMGAIHPRAKGWVGQRLAQAAYASVYAPSPSVITTGPVLAGCAVAGGGRVLTLTFTRTLLAGQNVSWSAGVSTMAENTALYVLTNATLPPDTGSNHHSGNGRDYRGPFANGNELGVTGWVPVTGSVGTDGVSLNVDLSPLNGAKPTAIRYAFGGGGTGAPFQARMCCGPTVDISTEPCAPASCPLKATGPASLPANPFFAAITEEGKCQCFAPMACDA